MRMSLSFVINSEHVLVYFYEYVLFDFRLYLIVREGVYRYGSIRQFDHSIQFDFYLYWINFESDSTQSVETHLYSVQVMSSII